MDSTTLDCFEPDGEQSVQASYSSLTLHRKCPQAWYYRHGLRIEKDETATPYLTIGRWWSALRAAEALARGREQGTLLEIPTFIKDKAEGYLFDPTVVTHEDVLRDAERRWKALSRDERDEFDSTLGATLPDRLSGMYELWAARNSERFEKEQPLGVEMFWKRSLPRPENDRAWSLLASTESVPKMHLIGFVDYLYYDRERRVVIVQDDKAPKDLGNSTSTVDDLMDSQLQLYVWGISPKLKALGGDTPRAVAYDRTCSVEPKTPQLTASGTLSKSITAYDLDTYLRWAQAGQEWGTPDTFVASGPRKGQPKFGTYEIDPKMVEKLSSPAEQKRWHKRTVKPVSQPLVRAHLRSAVDTALDIWQTQTRAETVGEAARNLDRFGCGRCDYAELCRAQLLGGPSGDYDLESFGLRQRAERRTN